MRLRGSLFVAALLLPGHPAMADVRVAGQVRERYESSFRPGFGLLTPGRDDYLLSRGLLSAEVSAGDHVAFAGELVGGQVSGQRHSLPATQDDSLDVLRLYVDGSLDSAGGKLRFRGGRQPLALGAARLVSTRDNTNVRRAFDGLRVTWTRGGSQVDGFLLEPVLPRTGVFDDRPGPDQRFWGLYWTREVASPCEAGFDAYYLGLRAEAPRGTERRHTLGVRLFGVDHGQDWNLEAAGQWGSLGDSRIRAWTLSSDVGHTFSNWRFTPRVGFKADLISGDTDARDRKWGTFNPLFPKLSYFSDANVTTPANLIDVQPTLSLSLAKDLRVSGSWNVLWRYSRDDSFYLPPMKPVALDESAGRYLGQQWSAAIEWKRLSRLTLAASWVAFRPGSALRQAGGASGHFVFASAQVDF